MKKLLQVVAVVALSAGVNVGVQAEIEPGDDFNVIGATTSGMAVFTSLETGGSAVDIVARCRSQMVMIEGFVLAQLDLNNVLDESDLEGRLIPIGAEVSADAPKCSADGFGFPISDFMVVNELTSFRRSMDSGGIITIEVEGNLKFTKDFPGNQTGQQ